MPKKATRPPGAQPRVETSIGALAGIGLDLSRNIHLLSPQEAAALLAAVAGVLLTSSGADDVLIDIADAADPDEREDLMADATTISAIFATAMRRARLMPPQAA